MGKLNSQANWVDADADRLREARESAGIDLYTVARNNSLSNAQLLELEQGGQSYFYSASIKYNAGKKLLNFFGGQTEYDRLSEETKTQKHKDTAIVETFLEDAVQHLQPKQDLARKNASKALFYSIAISAICIATAFVVYPIYTNKTNADKTITNPQFSQLDKITESENSTPPTKQDSLPATQPTTTTIESPVNECVWTDNSTNLSAQNATKDGNYVYLVAMKELVVCIKDKTNKVSIVNLKANEPQNISGVAPLKLQSKDLDSLNIFYQGSKLQLPSKNTTEVNLVAIPIQ
jgi:cytoskeletal protein RodZ